MKAIGLDVGTTSICGVCVDLDSGNVLDTVYLKNKKIKGEHDFEWLQDPQSIMESVSQALSKLDGDSAVAIGISGQMHGILYVDSEGKAVSPLYSWQDGRGNLIYKDGETYAEYLTNHTGFKVASGYGMVTHFYNSVNNLVPRDAVCLCTIGDYVAMRLANEVKPILHSSNAASLGLFDIEGNRFDTEVFNPEIAPECRFGYGLLGGNIAYALGDNQASFIGSVADMENSLLVNVGTGSQVSVYSKDKMTIAGIETRPLVCDDYIMVGCALCGGHAFEILEGFFRSVLKMAGYDGYTSLYPQMDKMLAEQGELGDLPVFQNSFRGTREDALVRGSIGNISTENFTAGHFTVGILQGICQELYDMYEKINKKAAIMIGSGNGLRKNKALVERFEKSFDMKMQLPNHQEEAAYGAALYACVCVGHFKSIKEAQKIIKYN